MIDNEKVFEEVRVMHEAGVLADYACQEDPIPREDAVLLARFALASLDGLNEKCDAEKNGWIACSEQMPKDGRMLLVTGNGHIDIAYFDDGDCEGFLNGYVTHWMHLSDLPDVDELPPNSVKTRGAG
ncbi:hypothetical protein SGGMMB4_02675 [Sodalis glossinidius str. 'morsitans']|uniref:DUF551 domain-containing protein n=1 Tax=Sodalis glossinidius (strain morsitans) TaxID=343509 RepID=A0A193QIY6_SODGM|nr:DUF551 domain-containing protein [Sodalis glossinidius]CRL45131.1 hypothetical protein SGGMMB4_02675 [Sodalis glossinidius str. 'morsitans']